MYQGALSTETYMSWVETINCISNKIAQQDAEIRHKFYHIFINSYNIIVSIILVCGHFYGTTNKKNIDFMCYVELNHKYIGIIFSTIPLLTVLIIMSIVCFFIIKQLLSVFGSGFSLHNNDDMHIKTAFLHVLDRIGNRGKLTIMRLILLPIAFFSMSVIIVSYDTFFYDSSNEIPGVVAYCIFACGPIINAIIWIFTDS